MGFPSYPCIRTDHFRSMPRQIVEKSMIPSVLGGVCAHDTHHNTVGDELMPTMSASPSSPNNSTPNNTAGSDNDQNKKAEAAAMERFAEVSLKSVPLPEGFDPNKRATVSDAFKTIKSDDLLKVHQAPCSRDGFITGIGSGAAIGFLRYIVGGEGSPVSQQRMAGSANIAVI